MKKNNIRINDHYTNKARDNNLVARSFYKLEEIDKKFQFFSEDTQSVIDIGCAPGSWLQYMSKRLEEAGSNNPTIIGFDLQNVKITLPGVTAYQQDITERDAVENCIKNHGIEQFDCIVSDMAPATIGMKDIDALRSVGLIEKTLWMYEKYLKPGGKFAIKIFMGPGFDEFVREMKDMYGAGNIVVFKPKSCRKGSKETYIVKKSSNG